MDSFTVKEKFLFKKLNTPVKVQDFLNSLSFNFEKNGETLRSPLLTLRAKEAHCFEGALLSAYILSLHGFTPYIIHLKATDDDYDHVIMPFQINGFWGALSKTNHAVLRYREPIYKNIRELALSYFHEYFLNNGIKTLRQYSIPFNLNNLKKSTYADRSWVNTEKDLWELDKKLDKIKHYDIIPKIHLKSLRKADGIEIKAGKIVEYPSSRAKLTMGQVKNKVKILVFGTFDGLHKGHLSFFEQARKLADSPFLVVSIARDKNVKRIKKESPVLNEKKRLSLVKKCTLVDKAILAGVDNYLPHIMQECPDIIALGYDQKAYVDNLKKDLKSKGLKVKIVRLKPYKEHIYKNHLLKKRSVLK